MKKILLAATLLFSFSSYAVDIETCSIEIQKEYEQVWVSIQELEPKYGDELLAILEDALESGVELMPNCLYALAQIREVGTAVSEL